MRLIDADALVASLEKTPICIAADKSKMFHLIEKATTVDAVEVVRCKDCRHSDYIGHTLYCYECDRNTNEDGYCSEGC